MLWRTVTVDSKGGSALYQAGKATVCEDRELRRDFIMLRSIYWQGVIDLQGPRWGEVLETQSREQ